MRVVAICSGKGSPGATFVAVNLAAAMGRRERALLLDLDPAGGDVAAYLGLDPRRGLYPLLRMNGTIQDVQALEKEAEERAGFRAVCGFPDACEPSAIWRLADLVRLARKTDSFVIADAGRITDKTPSLLADVDEVVLVVRPDLVSVAGAERGLRLLQTRGFPIERVKAIVSGLERRRPADVAEVASALGVEVLGTIPLDRRGARKALISQTPQTKGALSKAFEKAAATMTAAPSAPVPAGSIVAEATT